MEEEIIDPNLASYEQFFDHGWCKRIFELVKSSPLRAAVDTLMLAWRSTDGRTDCRGLWFNNLETSPWREQAHSIVPAWFL